MKYHEMSDSDKKTLLEKEYGTLDKSFAVIAKAYDTYPNKLRRDAKKFGIAVKSRAEAQQLALKSGRSKHPTKGKNRSLETKEKISNKIRESWENFSDKELQRRSKLSKQQWANMGQEEKQELMRAANEGIRRAAQEGSKLEKIILSALIKEGFQVEFHKEHLLSNEKIHIDLYLPNQGIAIEIDGPSHLKPIWGQEAFERCQKTDSHKNGLLTGRGISVIRIQHENKLSKIRMTNLAKQTVKKVSESKNWSSPRIEFIRD